MINGILKNILVFIVTCSLIVPSFVFAEKLDEVAKKFVLTSNNWEIVKSDCDSWYDYSTDQKFNVPGWQVIGQPTVIYGYKSDYNVCGGDLAINNKISGMYSLFAFNTVRRQWQKISDSSLNIVTNINSNPQTLVLAKAFVSPTQDVFGDFSIKNGLLLEQTATSTPSTTLDIIGDFNLASSTATSTIFWSQPLTRLYRLARVNKNDQVELLPIKVDSRKNTSETEISPQIEGVRILVIKVDKKSLGKATWYAYKKCDCAASRDYPKGTKLKVTNLSSGKYFGKSVIVKVNDYGPMEYTGNLIDLDKVAFKKIGLLSSGVMPVSVEVVK